MPRSPRAIRLEADVDCDPLEAFELFTRGVGDWWAAAAMPAAESPDDVSLEPYAGGRVVKDGEKPAREVELGRMMVWQPGSRLEAEWREPTWPPDVVTRIATTFESSAAATRISVEHTGFEQLGAAADRTAQRYEGLWAELLAALVRRRA
jgi:hypothetical protein